MNPNYADGFLRPDGANLRGDEKSIRERKMEHYNGNFFSLLQRVGNLNPMRQHKTLKKESQEGRET